MHMQTFIDKIWRLGYRVAYRGATVYWAIVKPRIRGAFVAVWYEDKVLLIKNSYRRLLMLPGGLVARREEWHEGALRELREEVGLDCHEDDLEHVVSLRGYNRNENDQVQVFELILDKEPDVKIDNREVVWAEFVRAGKAVEMDLAQAVKDYLQNRESILADKGGSWHKEKGAQKSASDVGHVDE